MAPADAAPTDAVLVTAAQSGDRSALEQLVARHAPWLFNLAVRMVWSVSTAMAARGPLAQLTDAQLELGVQLLMTQVRLVRVAMSRMRDGGSVTLTTGALATHPMPGTSVVAMAGAGLEGLIRAAALDAPRRLRLNSVSPGWVKETMEQAGLDGASGMPAQRLADFYVSAVEGTMTGTIINPTS